MIPADDPKVLFAREWHVRGQCPGCGCSLAAVAGQGVWHTSDGRPRNAGLRSEQTCSWTADDLTSLVLIGSGQLHSLESA